MNAAIAFLTCFLVALSVARPGDDKYTTRYDYIDVKEILENDKLSLPYILCLLDKGKCTPEGKELKSHIHDALETECSKCTEKQKTSTEIVFKHLINHKQGYWKELCAKYDPLNKYAIKYEERLREIKEKM